MWYHSQQIRRAPAANEHVVLRRQLKDFLCRVAREPSLIECETLDEKCLTFQVPVDLVFCKARTRGNVVLDKLMVNDFEPQAFGKSYRNVAPARTKLPRHCDNSHSGLRAERCRAR